MNTFNAQWYLTQYPDVAAAGVDPLQHYETYGQFEGRLPCDLVALRLEPQLWQSANPEPLIAELKQIESAQQPLQSALASWVLGRWFASFGDWPQTVERAALAIADDLALHFIGHQGPFLLAFSAFYWGKCPGKAEDLLQDPRFVETPDKMLARSMLQQGKSKLAVLNTLFQAHDLTPVALFSGATLDTLMPEQGLSWLQQQISRWFFPYTVAPHDAEYLGKVTVIVPCFNAAATLPTALRSLLLQTYPHLEILVADDCSTDHSARIVEKFAQQDSRIRLVRLPENGGAYVARNTAMLQATGDFITTHDADDWSHPQKIALQVAALLALPDLMATVSHWVRCSASLEFQRWRMEDGLIYRNVSSLLFRKKVVDAIGFWDCVSVNADTEYYYRILQQFGQHSISEVLPGVPLSFGRADAHSLSQTKASHLRTQFRGLRKDYQQAALAWQQQGGNLYLAAAPDYRPFMVPPLMCRGSSPQRLHNCHLYLAHSSLFDSPWYLRRYPDVAATGQDPLHHFIDYGVFEGRDPHPLFSLTGYAFTQKLSLTKALEAWLCEPEPFLPCVVLGKQSLHAHQGTLLIAGHLVSHALFGAERSLLDVVKALSPLGYRLIVTLPSAQSEGYLQQLLPHVAKLVILPTPWWRKTRSIEPQITAAYQQLMTQHQVDLVYLNTSVLYEPALAAKSLAIPTVMHVRELPAADPSFCQLIATDPEGFREHLVAIVDYFIANSQAVASWLAVPNQTIQVANILDVSAWPAFTWPKKTRLQVGMLSSNLPKKGLDDFVAVAKRCAELGLPIDFLLFGPHNAHVEKHVSAGLPSQLKLQGYVDEPQQALAQCHVVLNLSQFQESFGRSVLEGMAAGRVVVAYEWGALPEIINANYGFLLPYQDIDAVVACLTTLQQDRALCVKLGKAARAAVSQRFAPELIASQIHNYFQRIIAHHPAQKQ